MVSWVRPLVTSFLLSNRGATTRSRYLFMSSSSSEVSTFSKPIVQYLFVRRDLDWPQGAVAAQAAHASVAAIVEGTKAQDAATLQYTAPEQLTSMTKSVYGVDNEEELKSIQAAWESKFGSESYHLWIEQPENIPTALATWPVERTNAVSKVVKKLKVTYL